MSGASFPLRQRLGDFVGTLDEKLRDGTERPTFQGNDPNRQVGHGQFNGQDLQFRAPGEKWSRDRKKTASRRRVTANRIDRSLPWAPALLRSNSAMEFDGD
jgi:hypothetical protein